MKNHIHVCHCGTANKSPHIIGENGCQRFMVESPIQDKDHQTLGCKMWKTHDGDIITDHTLRQQRGYFQHECGCWSRWEGSYNSIRG